MAERPILFNAVMVRAILAGRKTQTRRAIRPQPYIDGSGNFCWNGIIFGQDIAGVPLARALASQNPSSRTGRVLCPFGKIGDRLWVRETWMDLTGTGIGHLDTAGKPMRYAYGAESPSGSASDEARKDFGLKWRPSIHMPREACRLVLEITDVRVERLQTISDADAIAEGLMQAEGGSWLPGPCDHPAWAFHLLWNQVYGESSWDSNPWVWVIEFKQIDSPQGVK